MAAVAPEPPSPAEGSGVVHDRVVYIQSGRNDEFESALRVMKQMGVDCGVLLETKLIGVYMRWSSGCNF